MVDTAIFTFYNPFMPIRNKWYPFKKELIEALPMKEPGVYEVGKARGDKVLYIGKSDNSIRSRLLIHKGKIDFKDCTHFRKQRTTSHEADNAEIKLFSSYIKKHGDIPLINKIHPPKRDIIDKLLWG